ncbi:hypothetical protein GCM10010232_65940 [Streptomyces amakusaensis]|uniref:Uncharacterized protein n=1 Tax=Streptomyces amakusaensis TaxID=67271 RepID=A0ABW0ARF8_9ACTN
MATTPAQFREQHGDCTVWSAEDFESYGRLTEFVHPDFERAAREGLVVVGQHADDRGLVVVDLATTTDLAARCAEAPRLAGRPA